MFFIQKWFIRAWIYMFILNSIVNWLTIKLHILQHWIGTLL